MWSKKKIVYIAILSLVVIFAFVSIFNYVSPAKRKANILKYEYYHEYLDCKDLWLECLDINYYAGANRCKQLMDDWDDRMDEQEEIVRAYNARATVFGILAGLSLAGGVVFFVLDKKRTKALSSAT